MPEKHYENIKISNHNEIGKILEGVWDDKGKIVEIIGKDNDNAIPNDNGEKLISSSMLVEIFTQIKIMYYIFVL